MTKRLDWQLLKMEWLAGSETLNAFRIRKEIVNKKHFYEMIEEHGFLAHRDRLHAAALAKAAPRLIADLSRRYYFQEKQWLTVEGIIARALKKLAATEDIEKLAPEVLESLTRSLERALKSRKLVHGEPTGEAPADGVPTPGTLNHAQIVGLIQAMSQRDPRYVVPESMIEAEVVPARGAQA